MEAREKGKQKEILTPAPGPAARQKGKEKERKKGKEKKGKVLRRMHMWTS